MNALQLCPRQVYTAVTAEALRAKIDRKSVILHQRGHFDPKFQVQGVAPTNNFGLTNCAKIIGGGDPLYLKFWIKVSALVQNHRFSIYFRS